MSLSYSKENDQWNLTQITEDEKDVLLENGANYMSMMIGAAILKKMTESNTLMDIDPPTDAVN